MDNLVRQAPAKINLFLYIAGRRPDGYHLIDSLMVPIDLADTLSLKQTRGGIRLRCPGHGELEGEDNLAWRAASSYFQANPQPFGIDITINKRIPVAAGLGGGSSDGASTLLALQQMATNPLPANDLATLALSLGADVPFFLQECPCRARGIGEQLQPVDEVPLFWVLLACAPFPLATRDVYQRLNCPLTFGDNHVIRSSPHSAVDFWFLVAGAGNHLQPIAEEMRPEIGEVREELQQTGAAAVLMSGSGPTVFGLYRTYEHAEGAKLLLREHPGWNYFVARSMISRPRTTA